jgi:hypothetical protein
VVYENRVIPGFKSLDFVFFAELSDLCHSGIRRVKIRQKAVMAKRQL